MGVGDLGLGRPLTGGGRGVVVLPTGTGKTHLASMAIEKVGRPTLIVTPTIDLMNQWYDELSLSFGVEIGLLGGGYYDIQPLTVTTYEVSPAAGTKVSKVAGLADDLRGTPF